MTGGFPINILNTIKAVPEVCTICCATANPVEVIVVDTGNGRGILGVVDGVKAPYTTRQATCDVRRLKRKGLIHRLHNAHRYELTTVGRAVAVLFTKSYTRVLTPALAILDPRLPEDIRRRTPLATAWRAFQRALDDFVERSFLPA